MPRVPIDDLDDPRLAMYRQLKATNQTRDKGQFVVEGQTLVDRLLDSRFPVASVLATERWEPTIAARVSGDVAFYIVPQARIEALVGFNFHRGVLACGLRRPWPDVDELARANGAHATFVVCPQVDNPDNLGAIIRTADVLGVDAVFASGRCPDPLSRRVLRVSMGAALRLPVIVCDDLAATLDRLRHDYGCKAIATVVDPTAGPLDGYRRDGRIAVLLGCEAHGLAPEWRARCDGALTIPMRPGAESLNLGVAAGIILYHLTRPSR